MKQVFSKINERLSSLLPKEHESPENRNFKILVWGFLGILMLGLIAGTLTFVLTLQGAESTMVPNLEGEELIAALEKLQSRGLNVTVQQRFDSDPSLRGHVIDQHPSPGSQVKVGRNVRLTISQGPTVGEVGDYVGMRIADLQRQLAADFTNYEALLEVREEFISYVFSEEPEGMILDQEPAPGTELNGYTDLKLLVSRGPEVIGIEAPDTIGLDYRQAIGMLAVRRVPFVFRLVVDAGESSGVVVSQSPVAGETIDPGSPLVLRINPLATSSSNQVSAIYYGYIPEYALPVVVRVEFVTPDGDIQPYFETEHSGGELSFPYALEVGSRINVYADGQIISRYTVKAPEPEVDAEAESENGNESESN